VITKDAGDVSRDAMTQPNVYWTLNAPFATIIGLYTNVPEGGRLDDNQINWFKSELSNAPIDKALLVAMHHPIYSADRYHTGSEYMGQILEGAIQKTGRMPDAVFAGHVHNYQRFTRIMNDRDVPFIVAGAGGYWHLHYIAKDQDGNKLQTPYHLYVSRETFSEQQQTRTRVANQLIPFLKNTYHLWYTSNVKNVFCLRKKARENSYGPHKNNHRARESRHSYDIR